MTYTNSAIEKIINGFQDSSLSKAQWTHHAHLIVSLWYGQRYDSLEALKLLRSKIKTYNEAVGTPNTNSGGYHETITHFWIHQTKQFLKHYNSEDFSTLVELYIQSDYADKSAPLAYYSRPLLFSIEARKNIIDPDIKALPIID